MTWIFWIIKITKKIHYVGRRQQVIASLNHSLNQFISEWTETMQEFDNGPVPIRTLNPRVRTFVR